MILNPARESRHRICQIAVSLCLVFSSLRADINSDSGQAAYRIPPDVLSALADVKLTPVVSIDPTNHTMAVLERPGLVSIAELAQPELKLAGIRINPRITGQSRGYLYTGLFFIDIASGKKLGIVFPDSQVRISHCSWSPDGRYFAFSAVRENGIELWVAEASTAALRQLTGACLNATLGKPFIWRSNSRSLLVRVIPRDRGTLPAEPIAPSGPIILENAGKTAPAKTYTDLLRDPHDELLFEYYATCSIRKVTIEGLSVELGEAGIIDKVRPSPDGAYILVEKYRRPFSYTLPYQRFPRQTELWDSAGAVISVLQCAPLQDQIPVAFGSVRTGPRDYFWRSDKPAVLGWVEAQDGGDAKKQAEIRDKVFLYDAPFTVSPYVLVTCRYRFEEIIWGNDSLALLSETWWPNRARRTWMIDPSHPGAAPQLLWDISFEDRYHDPGYPVLVYNENGAPVLLMKNTERCIYLFGDGASPEGDRPFVDEFDLRSLRAKRLFQSTAPYLEYPIRLLGGGRMITSRESRTQPPNYYVKASGSSRLKALTSFPHPAPGLMAVQKKIIHYRRSDGLELNGTLYLPAGYDPKKNGTLPLLIWAYPRSYISAQAAGQVSDSPYRFNWITPWSPLVWLTRGYAVLDDPAMPIVAQDSCNPNDRFIEQLVDDARAAVDAVVRLGVADSNRIAIGGESYGAFMVANLLAHSRLFKAGIAQSGAYNRTLTPFGFQAEDRTLWEARETYTNMSPLMFADKIKDPILLIHGQADNNVGTLPIQSERFYEALRGNGATARLVLLPLEDHMFASRESVMQVLWEIDQWLGRWIKNAAIENSRIQ